jgi:FKBP-type peptidyl-prolyl cis-trans isomerase
MPALAGPPLPTEQLKPPPQANTTESGLAYVVLERGKGKLLVTKDSTVTVHYNAWLASDGTQFDSSIERGTPFSAPLNRVIKGWSEGVQLMRVGETTRFWIPAELAYGNEGLGGKPKGILIFDVELIAINPVPSSLKPKDLVVPKKAITTESGLAYLVLRPGRGSVHPVISDTVEVHLTGWQATTGEPFDSSITRGQPMTLPLNRLIPGMTEGLLLMVVGETTRFWIPAELAYGNGPSSGGPPGLLVFDVELLRIR